VIQQSQQQEQQHGQTSKGVSSEDSFITKTKTQVHTKDLGVQLTKGLGVQHTKGLGVQNTKGLDGQLTKSLDVQHTKGLDVQLAKGLGVQHTKGLDIQLTKGLGAQFAKGLSVQHTKDLDVQLTKGLGMQHTKDLGVQQTQITQQYASRKQGTLCRAKGGIAQQTSQIISTKHSEQSVHGVKVHKQVEENGQHGKGRIVQYVKTKESLLYHGPKHTRQKTYRIQYKQRLHGQGLNINQGQVECQCTKGASVQFQQESFV
jgi:hypothetical protein